MRTRHPRPSGPFWQQLREAVFRRDGYRCSSCGHSPKRSDRRRPESNMLTVDHVVPMKDGGRSVVENLRPLCRACHHIRNSGAPPLDLSPFAGKRQRQAPPESAP
jgi:5-methylcytosine-specific restriction endonuclease McrA